MSQGGQIVVEMCAVDGLDGLGNSAVERDSPGGREIGIERVAHEGVGEAIPGAGSLDHQAGLGRLLERGEKASSSRFPATWSTGISNSAPTTAATRRTRLAASDSRDSRLPTTSRTPSGMPSSSTGRRVVQRPSRCSMAPVSARWRRTSRTKKMP